MHCFTTPQAKHIAGKLINGQLRDTILIDLSDVNDSLSYATKIQKQVITRNESAMSTYRNENYLRNEEAVACEKQKQLEIKTQKKDKLKKIVVAVLVGFVAGVLVEKH